MRFVTSALVLAFTLATTQAALAKTVTYNCATDARDGIVVPQQVMFAHNEDTGELLVIDPIIQHVIGKPIPGTITDNNDKRITFTWQMLELKNNKGQRMGLRYNATYMRATGVFSLTAKPLNYSNDFRARGTCTLK
jgi:hypothetical protein